LIKNVETAKTMHNLKNEMTLSSIGNISDMMSILEKFENKSFEINKNSLMFSEDGIKPPIF